MPVRFECFYCNDAHAEILLDKLDDVCARCDGICSRVTVCEDCRTHDSVEGSDQCLQCLSDMIVADPGEFDGLNETLRAMVARELAYRLRARLSVRQAA
jgi:hypothetical protein